MRSLKPGTWAVFGLVISYLNMMMTTCMCGHMSRISLPGSVVGAAMAWFAFAAPNRANWPVRVLVMLSAALTMFILIKNLGDVLWWGHEPLLE